MTRVLIVIPRGQRSAYEKVRIESSSESDGVRESDAGTFSDSEVEEDINYCEDVNDAALPGVQNAPSSTETQAYLLQTHPWHATLSTLYFNSILICLTHPLLLLPSLISFLSILVHRSCAEAETSKVG